MSTLLQRTLWKISSAHGHNQVLRFSAKSSNVPLPSPNANPEDKLDDAGGDCIARPKVKAKKPRPASQSVELRNFISAFPFWTTIPSAKKLFRVQKNAPESCWLVDETVAPLIAEKLIGENLDPEATVIECNAGYGSLTSELISKFGFKTINCFEEQSDLGELLVEKYKNQVNVIPEDFMAIPCLHHIDVLDGGSRVMTALQNLKRNSAKSTNKKLYIFGTSPTASPVSFAIKTLATGQFIFHEDWDWDVTYYLALGSKPFTVFNANPESGFTEYRQPTVSFQLFFKHECLGQLPRNAFIPWQTTVAKDKSEDSRAQIRHDPKILQFTKFKPNTEVIKQVGKDGLLPLWYFVRHHLYVRRSAVIPELEQWIPGCGPRLIRQGYTIYTQFGSLPPAKILELFLEFSSWPEYKSSSFIAAVEKFSSKLEPTDDDI